MPKERRILDFYEVEAWLRELPWWREWVKDIGGATTPSVGPGGHGGGKPGSPTEREALNLYRISCKVDLLDAWVGKQDDHDNWTVRPKLPEELARLIHLRYMAKTATMGLPVAECCQELHISHSTFVRQRERALSLLISAIYTSNIELGKPYCDCRDELVPVAARQGGRQAEIKRLEREAAAWDQRANRNEAKGDKDQAEWCRQKAKEFRERAQALRGDQEVAEES